MRRAEDRKRRRRRKESFKCGTRGRWRERRGVGKELMIVRIESEGEERIMTGSEGEMISESEDSNQDIIASHSQLVMSLS